MYLPKLKNAKYFDELKGVSGVYKLIYDDQVIYVGQSVDLQRRLKEHANPQSQLQKNLKKVAAENGKCNRSKAIAMYTFLLDEEVYDNVYVDAIPMPREDLDWYELSRILMYRPQFNYKGLYCPIKGLQTWAEFF